MPKRLRRLAELSVRDGLLLGQLIAGALAAAIGLRLVPLPRLTGVLARCARHRGLRHWPLSHAGYKVERLAELADVAAHVAGGDRRCLLRSLLLFWLLKARQEPVTLRLGIRKETGALRAHAWIETRGRVLGSGADTPAPYTPLVGL
jgi:transglutaminase superfamily protein